MTDFDVEVFYDGDCPLCTREVRLLRRLDKRKRILFVDIADEGFARTSVGVTWEALMDRIHARLPDGTIVEGVEVFRRLYTAVGFGSLVALTRLPGVAQLLDLGYRWFAKNRPRLTGRCADRACELHSRPMRAEVRQLINEPTVIIEFGADAAAWHNISDPVMGGISSGEMVAEDGLGVFKGVVSLEHSGGFASVRTAEGHYDLSGYDGLTVRVRGDGKRYGLRLRTSEASVGVNYQVDFRPAPGAWLDIRLSFACFQPLFRGRLVAGHPPLDPANIKTFGLIIADRQEGPFRLELASIAGHRES
ncbi:MAG: CIA30 family protein [Candidatus Latescibacteria bacterium]|nr:CIA30 family protein [Candidatus Latescibacterota bacterium]